MSEAPWRILGTYRGKTEEVDTADTREEAKYLQGEYALAYGSEWTVTIRHRNARFTGRRKKEVTCG